MKVVYGTYEHEEGEVALAYECEPIRSESNVLLAKLHRYTLQGALVAASESAMDTAVAALIAAYTDGKDLALQLTAGTNSQLALASSNCVGGTRVTRLPSFPDMRNAGYTAYLPYTLAVEGEIAETQSDRIGLMSFTETIQRMGGGPRYAYRETLAGPPVRQRVRAATVYKVVQQGEAVGYLDYPTPPRPIWASSLVEAPTITVFSPRFRSPGKWTEYRVAWSYSYESSGPLPGVPNRQTR